MAIIPLLSLILLSLLSLSTATATAPSLSESLSSLGFHDLAAAAAASSHHHHNSYPITVFVPTAASLSTCPTCSLPLLLAEHTLPGLFPLSYLLSLLPGTRIQSLSPSHCLTVTHDDRSLSRNRKAFVSGVEITHPELLSSPSLIVHVVSGFLSPLSPVSCSLERMTSLFFPPVNLLLSPPPPSDHVMRLMLKDAVLRLKLSGYSVLAIAIRMKASELAATGRFTVFAIDDAAVFSSGGHAYVAGFGMHVVPGRLMLGGDLERVGPGTVLGTMDVNNPVVVTATASGGGTVKVNYVGVSAPDLIFNSRIAVHGLKMPFPSVNVTAAAALAVDGRSDDMAVGYSGGGGRSKWTTEIEDHHGL